MGGERQDLIVNSKGQCFICLCQIDKPDHLSVTDNEPFPTSHRSLRCLSRYLELDIKKLIYDNGSGSPDLFGNAQALELKSELCKRCSGLVETFSKNFRQLEKIQMEIASSLGQIHHQFLNSDKDFKPEKFQDLIEHELQSMDRDVLNEKSKQFNVLRLEARRKCRLKLKAIGPRVRVQNLNMKGVRAEKRKIIFSSHPYLEIEAPQKAATPEIETCKIKTEQVPSNLILDEYDDDGDDGANSYMEEDPLSDSLTSQNLSCHLYEGSQVQCHKCNRVFNWNCNLVNHPQKHCQGSRCILCDEEFPNLPSLNSHISTAHIQIPVNTTELVNLPPGEFSARLCDVNLSKAQISAIRKIRRKERNRIAAMNSRDRKRNKLNQLEKEVEGVRETKDFLVGERRTLLDRRKQLVERYNLLYDTIFQTLRDVEGNLYNPSECGLEQDQNGIVVMVRPNTTQ